MSIPLALLCLLRYLVCGHILYLSVEYQSNILMQANP